MCNIQPIDIFIRGFSGAAAFYTLGGPVGLAAGIGSSIATTAVNNTIDKALECPTNLGKIAKIALIFFSNVAITMLCSNIPFKAAALFMGVSTLYTIGALLTIAAVKILLSNCCPAT